MEEIKEDMTSFVRAQTLKEGVCVIWEDLVVSTIKHKSKDSLQIDAIASFV